MAKYTFVETPEPLPGKLTLKDLWPMATGQVVGAGIVTFVGPAIGLTGRSMWLAYLVALVLGLIFNIRFIQMTKALRLGGGNYSLVAAGLGPRWGGIYESSMLITMFCIGTFAMSFGMYLNALWPVIPQRLAAIVFLTIILIINICGVSFFAKTQRYMTIFLVITLFLYMFLGFTHLKGEYLAFSNPEFSTGGFAGFISAVFMLYGSTSGYNTVISYGRDTKQPYKDIPKAMIYTFFTIAVLYIGVGLVNCGTLPLEDVAGKTLVVTAREFMPEWLVIIFVLGGPVMALATTASGSLSSMQISSGQCAADGWLPRVLATENKKGIRWPICVILYLLGVVPIALGFNINQIVFSMLLFLSLVMIFIIVACFPLYNKYEEAFKAAGIKKGSYYFWCVMGGLVNIGSGITNCMNLPAVVVITCISLYVLVCAWIFIRSKKVDAEVLSTVWPRKAE